MAGGSHAHDDTPVGMLIRPQWSPGLMAGGRTSVNERIVWIDGAAMEPRPDGRGKPRKHPNGLPRSRCRNGAPA